MRFKWDKKKFSIKGRTETTSTSFSIRTLLIVILFSVVQSVFSQDLVTTVGIQYKPIFSTDYTGGGLQTTIEDNLKMTLELQRGSSFGLIIRKGMTKSISVETGINSVTRRFELNVDVLDTNFSETLNYKLTNYEIPLQGLVFIQLGERSWINSSVGVSLSFFPVDLLTTKPYFAVQTARYRRMQFALIANIGYEYRTEKSGYWYIGTSFYNPFRAIAQSEGLYSPFGDVEQRANIDINGNYITLDLRYFFNERPEK